jgi:hypothetical protein
MNYTYNHSTHFPFMFFKLLYKKQSCSPVHRKTAGPLGHTARTIFNFNTQWLWVVNILQTQIYHTKPMTCMHRTLISQKLYSLLLHKMCNRNDSFTKMTKLWARKSRNHNSIPNNFSSLQSVQANSGAHPACLLVSMPRLLPPRAESGW